MNLILISQAQNDLAVASLWYESQKQGLGLEFINEVEKTLSSISQSPFLYLIKRKECRTAKIKRFPFVIQYTEHHQSILVIAILHTSKKPNSWVDRL